MEAEEEVSLKKILILGKMRTIVILLCLAVVLTLFWVGVKGGFVFSRLNTAGSCGKIKVTNKSDHKQKVYGGPSRNTFFGDLDEDESMTYNLSEFPDGVRTKPHRNLKARIFNPQSSVAHEIVDGKRQVKELKILNRSGQATFPLVKEWTTCVSDSDIADNIRKTMAFRPRFSWSR